MARKVGAHPALLGAAAAFQVDGPGMLSINLFLNAQLKNAEITKKISAPLWDG